MKDDSSNPISVIFPGYKPLPPRESDEWTAVDWRKFTDFIVLLQHMKNKNEARDQRKG